MPRKRRADNNGYPTGWTWHHGALYYMVPKGLESRWNGQRKFRLGANEYEAYKTWTDRIERPDVPNTISEGFDRYILTVLPTLAPGTRSYYLAAIKELRPIFGHMVITEFEGHHAYQYRNKRAETSKKSANRGCELLSSFFTAVGQWGVPGYKSHPLLEIGFRKLSLPGRGRIVEPWEIDEMLSLKPSKYGRSAIPMMQAYVRLKVVSGRRRIEILRLKTTDFLDVGIRWTLAKSKQSKITHLITDWTPELRAAVDAALAARPVGKKPSKSYYRKPVDISPWVFCKADGTPYLDQDGEESDAFGSAWGRFLDKLLAETKITERFFDSDLRAKAANDAEDIGHAQKLLGHTTQATLRKHYRRKPERVKPVR